MGNEGAISASGQSPLITEEEIREYEKIELTFNKRAEALRLALQLRPNGSDDLIVAARKIAAFLEEG